jgi:hypothetical protein
MWAHVELGRTRAPPARIRADANLAQIWAMDGSGQTCRSGCVTPLGRALATRQSDRTSSDAREHDASARWRCPYAV